MVKSIYSIIIASIILIVGGIFEQVYLDKTFTALKDDFTLAYQKINSGEATASDAIAIKTNWLDKKKKLHFFISHNDIKEMDLWLSESVAYLKLGDLKESVSKLEVAINLAEQIPKNYLIRFENIL